MASQQVRATITATPKYRKILVGYDGSVNSDRALARAATIAKECEASLSIIVVVNSSLIAYGPMTPPVPREVFEDVVNNGKATLARAMESAGAILPQVTGSVEDGNPGACILNLAANSGVDLIVLGRRGISGVERFLLGGVSSNVVAHSKCDVLIVR